MNYGKETVKIKIKRVQKKYVDSWIVSGGAQIQNDVDKFGIFSYSHLKILIPIEFELFEKGRRLELIDNAPSRLKDKEIILEIINEFINKTKIFSKLY